MSIKQGNNYIAAGGGTPQWGNITGTLSNQTDLQTALNGKQDVATAVNYDNISNCITEIPQDIKLELNNGTLTLKAGSKVYIPNGFEQDGTTPKFDVVVTESDRVYGGGWGNNQSSILQFYDQGLSGLYKEGFFSGATAPTAYQFMMWYDTVNNLIKFTMDYGSTWSITHYSFPLCIMYIGEYDYTITSIDQVFNGFGYIGSTVFALPGVKGLIPNGRNADGTLKNTETITNNVLTYTNTDTSTGNYYIQLRGNFISRAYNNPSNWRYDEERNIILWNNTAKQEVLFAGNLVLSSGRVESLTPKTAFHAVDYNDAVLQSSLATCHVVVETYVNGSSWYRIWSDGWIEQGGRVSISQDTQTTVTLLKTFSNTNYTALISACRSGTQTGGDGNFTVEYVSASQFKWSNGDDFGGTGIWYACGY